MAWSRNQHASASSRPSDTRPLDEPSKPVYVTSPTLPPLAELIPLLEQIWSNRTLTNMGPFHQQFESAIASYCGADHVSLHTNATIALTLAVKQSVAAGDEVITTPFSFVATANSIVWAGAVPVFADVEEGTLNLDPEQIERHITPRTKAILAVHCYGRPCRTEAIEAIARKHGLKVIYDAAHAFGVRHRGKSLAAYGDLSVLSFHATKVFNTFEGGAIVCRDRATKTALEQLSNHGIVDEATVTEIGLNGKMSEFNAALGLVQLRHFWEAIDKRRACTIRYLALLSGISGIRCLQEDRDLRESNCYAFPILVESRYPLSRDALQAELKAKNIYARRYFHPLISDMPMYAHHASARRENLPVASAAATQVLCLPLFPDLDENVIQVIADTIRAHAVRRAS